MLLVEDTRSLASLYEAYLSKAGFRVECAYDAESAVAAYDRLKPRIVLLDLVLPDQDGLTVLRKIHGTDISAKVVVITANGSINRAVEAMREGAFDFLVKPFDERRLIGAVENALTLLGDEAAGGPAATEPDMSTAEGMQGFIGSSEPMRRIYSMVQSIARSTATVFITGESGTGKEICAQAIHDLSVRRKGPFVPVNCGAIPRDLLESELFGHLRGSFTGAVLDKRGAAAVADGGTLFLDEICEMDLALQTKLLRFLQTSMIQPVGATEASKVDVRIVCATNRDPGGEVRAGRFREDLYYRLHVVPIELPPLRARGSDVIAIAEVLLAKFSEEEERDFKRLSPAARAALKAYPWPGNVRELQNVLRNVVVLNEGEEVTREMLPPALLAAADGADGVAGPGPALGLAAGPAAPAAAAAQGAAGADGAGHEAAVRSLVGVPLAEMERRFIEATIDACNGSIPKAARVLDVSPSTLYRKREAWTRGQD
ncbi:sigma-54-dependent transcriptional regulator [Paralimibaculum aggregatum]|uniref:sigma-54-dependent transcriptional regulator n=1 Tax=Paralimibaculum aggregatum TaxID=3036245 RepID=UPI002555FE74|nr:sigma-54 dependent transcriptional regulator [Limibaculum sp. NKW23]